MNRGATLYLRRNPDTENEPVPRSKARRGKAQANRSRTGAQISGQICLGVANTGQEYQVRSVNADSECLITPQKDKNTTSRCTTPVSSDGRPITYKFACRCPRDCCALGKTRD